VQKPTSITYINNPYLQRDKVIKRQYQLSIFATCARSNCLVVFPTGLGKTLVALLLTIQCISEKKNSKVIFLAPTRPLVDQHLRTFKALTTIPEEQMVVLMGNITPAKRIQIYKDAQFLFMTPQVLQNDLIGNRIDLNDVSLLIFDEAHRATGDYAYVFLANKYIQQNPNGKILAMTASPGKNREKIEEVMTNLHLNAIEIRTEDDPDVKPYLQEVEMVWKDVDLPPEMLEILHIFTELMKKVATALFEKDLIDSKNVTELSRKDLLAATTVLDGMIAKGNQGGQGSDLSHLLFLKKVLTNGMRISHMQELLEAHGLTALKTFVDKSIEEIKDGKGGVSLRELFQSQEMQEVVEKINHLQTVNVEHPKLAVLMAILKEEFTQNTFSRVLLFCNFRDTVNMIVEAINQSELIRAERFVGQQAKGKEKGLSQKEQLNLVEKFKSGEYNVLVATSVAEEGLDISECDVVIFYDIVPGEIRAIQRRGRTGRNRKGKVYLLKTKGTREEGYFWAERQREREMKRVLAELKRELSPKYSINTAQNNIITNPNQKRLDGFVKNAVSTPSVLIENTEIIEDENSTSKDKSKYDPIPISEEKQNLSDPIHSFDEELDSIDYPNSKKLDLTPSDATLKTGNYYVFCDSRETASPVARELSLLNAAIELRPLPTGDYIVSERVGIERKSIPDFTASIKDGRLFDELFRLRNQFSYPILILEGDLSQGVSIHRAAIMGTITSIMLKLNIFIYQTKTPQETAEMILALAKKEQGDQPKQFSLRFKKLPSQLRQQLEYIVSGIPGINAARAQELLSEFNTLQKLFNASPAELQNVSSIGKKLAETINYFATVEYNPKEKVENKKSE
jgi:Fanconi anemia group M protein